jgi:hypothetical protein
MYVQFVNVWWFDTCGWGGLLSWSSIYFISVWIISRILKNVFFSSALNNLLKRYVLSSLVDSLGGNGLCMTYL